jgi:hypothetical protein
MINYVNAGGNVYLDAGTGVSGAVYEANQWNTFLYNGVGGNIPISSSHPIFKNVSQLYQNNGNSVTDLFPSNPDQQVLVNSSAGGLYAVYSVPEPLTILGVGTALGFGAGFKRKLAKKDNQSKDN